MSQYFFRISHGRYSGASDQGSEFETREAAWAEMTKVCAGLVGGIVGTSWLVTNAHTNVEGDVSKFQSTRAAALPQRQATWITPKPVGLPAATTVPVFSASF